MLGRYLGRTERALPALLDEVRACIAEAPLEAARAAHQALGLLLSIGARGAAEMARELVDALNADRARAPGEAPLTTRVDGILRELESRWEATRERLRRELG
jgi:hypothetical protein